MTNRLLIGAALAAFTAYAPSFAQDAPPPPPPPSARAMRMRPPMPPLLPETRAEAEKRTADHFAKLDANKDGSITRAEIDQARDKVRDEMRARVDTRRKEMQDRAFAALDKDRNGAISREEFAAPPPPPERMAMDGPPSPPPGAPFHRRIVIRHMAGPPSMGGAGMLMDGRWFDRVDANHDGKITLAEAKTAADTMFDRYDTNHDGTIAPEERRMAFRGPMRRFHRFGPGGPGGPDGPPPAGG
jgi:Ca2+-binding EF-hand superfamily protein